MTTTEVVRRTFPTLANPPYPQLTHGLPFDEACAKHVKETFHAEKAYIIASNTLSKKTARLQDSLGSLVVGTWIGIPNHTPTEALIPIIHDVREKRADCIITIGGGSISDGAKLISFALANNVASTEELLLLPRITDDGTFPTTYGDSKPPTVPVICIPISLSGGEYSCFAGVTEPKTYFKYQFTHEKMLPSLMVLDGTLARSTPMPIWLASGVRSIDHCVEGFLSTNATEEGDASSIKALPLLVNGLLRTKQDPDDLEARIQCLLGSNLSMTLLYLGVRKGASHGIGHQLGPLGVAHGATSCILLPSVCKFNAVVNGEKQKVLSDLLCQQEKVIQVLDEAGIDKTSADLADILRAVFDHLGLPRCLKDVGVGEDRLDDLAQGCLKEVYVITNPRPMKTKDEIMELLKTVLN